MRQTLVILTLLVTVAAPAAASPFPESIPLPDGYQPEGVATRGSTAFVGSLADGDVITVDLRSGALTHVVDNHPDDGRVAVGIAVERGLVLVAGGPTGRAFVYDARTGAEVADLALTDPVEGTFVNDVVVAKGTAWFTDSFQPQLYAVPLTAGGVGSPETVLLSGPAADFVPGEFNLNGIEATGGELVVVNSTLGALFGVDPETGDSKDIDLGGQTVINGDGLLLVGRDLYVVRNFDNRVDVVRLGADLSTGEVVDSITSDLFRIPTTAAKHGDRLVLVNARFDDPNAVDFDLVQVPIP